MVCTPGCTEHTLPNITMKDKQGRGGQEGELYLTTDQSDQNFPQAYHWLFFWQVSLGFGTSWNRGSSPQFLGGRPCPGPVLKTKKPSHYKYRSVWKVRHEPDSSEVYTHTPSNALSHAHPGIEHDFTDHSPSNHLSGKKKPWWEMDTQ